jgi:NADPH:quinone reductase-like Zn-dependent oxidoreductase
MLEEDIPLPNPNEVLIQVLVTGVAHGDIMIRKGHGSPFSEASANSGL